MGPQGSRVLFVVIFLFSFLLFVYFFLENSLLVCWLAYVPPCNRCERQSLGQVFGMCIVSLCFVVCGHKESSSLLEETSARTLTSRAGKIVESFDRSIRV